MQTAALGRQTQWHLLCLLDLCFKQVKLKSICVCGVGEGDKQHKRNRQQQRIVSRTQFVCFFLLFPRKKTL